jgi:hypothetical protein
MNGIAYTMHNVLCKSVTIEARFTASSRSSGLQQYWSTLYGGIWRVFGDDRNRRTFVMLANGPVAVAKLRCLSLIYFNVV